MLDTDVDELERLRRANRDLAACLALPALWSGREPRYIVTTLLDVLVSMLGLELAYALIRDVSGETVHEEWRPHTTMPPAPIARAVEPWLGGADSAPVVRLPGVGNVRLARAPLRLQSGAGIVVAASVHSDFPGERDDVLLRAAVNQAGIALNNADVMSREQHLLAREQAARRETETAEGHLRLALDAGRMGTWEWTIGTGAVRWSPGLEAIHGLASGSFPGTFEAFQEDIHHDDRDRVLRAIAEALEQRCPHHVEYRIVRPDGVVRWVEGRGQLFLDAESRPDRMVGVCADVTERKQAEEERARLLAREQSARREAEGANRAKDEFLAVLSHELRTPLTTMLGWLRMLRTTRLDPDRQERALETIERNTLAQARMIDDLLDMSRIAAGKMTLDCRAMSLAPLVAEAVAALQREANAKGLTLLAQLDPTAGPVFADADRLRQVLMNLLANALKFTPAGGRVEVHLVGGGDVVRLIVRDTGVGIVPELLPHVFERFRQADWRHAGTQGGLGLGLAIVREIVELHGGAVEAQSYGPGCGAVFTVTFPLARAVTDSHSPAGG